jgi:hypothetical protein
MGRLGLITEPSKIIIYPRPLGLLVLICFLLLKAGFLAVPRLVAIGARVAFVMAFFIALLWALRLLVWPSTIKALASEALDGPFVLTAVEGSLVEESLV